MIEKEINKVLNELKHDFSNLRAEIVITEILENSMLEYTDINILNKSTFSRGYSRDIAGYKKKYNDEKDFSLDINLTRNGVYDKLPQAVFHDFHSAKYKKLDYRDYRRLRKKEENDARLFFQPIENEFFYQNLNIEKNERALINKFNILKDNFLIDFWNIDKDLSEKHLLKFLKLLPFANQISGNLKFVGLVLEKIINEKIHLERKDRSYSSSKRESTNMTNTLGVNFVLESNKSTILYPELIVNIGPVPPSRICNFKKDTPTLKFLDVFYSYFIPMEFEVKTAIKYNNKKQPFAINKNKAPILGLNTTI